MLILRRIMTPRHTFREYTSHYCNLEALNCSREEVRRAAYAGKWIFEVVETFADGLYSPVCHFHSCDRHRAARLVAEHSPRAVLRPTVSVFRPEWPPMR